MTKRFKDRIEAGQLLAEALQAYAHHPDAIALGLPRGGVPIAFEVAKFLNIPLDICLVRKLGVPNHKELAMGAIASDVRILNDEIIIGLGISDAAIAQVTQQEQEELQRRDHLYRGDRPFPEVKGRIVILIDDGIATGSTMRAAIAVLRHHHPQTLIVAVPVAPPSTCDELKAECDQLVCLEAPETLHSISLWYDNFGQTTDAEVITLLAEAKTFGQPSTT